MFRRAVLLTAFVVAAIALLSCSDDDEVQRIAGELCEHRTACEDETHRTFPEVPGLGEGDCVDFATELLEDEIDEEGVICRYAFDHWLDCQTELSCRHFLTVDSCPSDSEDLLRACGDFARSLVPTTDELAEQYCKWETVCWHRDLWDRDSLAFCDDSWTIELDRLRNETPRCFGATRDVLECLRHLSCGQEVHEECRAEMEDHRSRCDDETFELCPESGC